MLTAVYSNFSLSKETVLWYKPNVYLAWEGLIPLDVRQMNTKASPDMVATTSFSPLPHIRCLLIRHTEWFSFPTSCLINVLLRQCRVQQFLDCFVLEFVATYTCLTVTLPSNGRLRDSKILYFLNFSRPLTIHVMHLE